VGLPKDQFGFWKKVQSDISGNTTTYSKFENTISLLQPNWPENIFGKAYFMRPEFLILPMLAFSALLFIHKAQKEKRELIVFFVIIGLLGAFLAKGRDCQAGPKAARLHRESPLGPAVSA